MVLFDSISNFVRYICHLELNEKESINIQTVNELNLLEKLLKLNANIAFKV